MIILKQSVRHIEHIKIIIIRRHLYVYKFDYEISKTTNKTSKIPRKKESKFQKQSLPIIPKFFLISRGLSDELVGVAVLIFLWTGFW